jgi:SAM-dependent methyltransferase
LNRQFIEKHWYAYAYEQFETQTNDVDFILEILKNYINECNLNILEVACGGGRITIPLAKAGYNMTGFDADEYMLMRCYKNMSGINNIHCYHADALKTSWGDNYDVVIMAGNLLINIETDEDYIIAQKAFIKRAACSLKKNGYLLLDYDQHSDKSAEKFFNSLAVAGRLGDDTTYTDELGTSGNIRYYGNIYDSITRICSWNGHWELKTNNGEQINKPLIGHKYIPTLKEVYYWLSDSDFKIVKTYRNYTNQPLSENENDYVRATILAQKQ